MKINNELLENAITAELSARLKDYRISKSYTQKELADKAMISESTLRRFENGQEISLTNFIKLLRVLELSENLDMLLPDQSERPSFHVNKNTKRKRVRKKNKPENNWKWGDEK